MVTRAQYPGAVEQRKGRHDRTCSREHRNPVSAGGTKSAKCDTCCRRNFAFSKEQFMSTLVDEDPHASGFSELLHTVGDRSICIVPFRICHAVESPFLRVVSIDRKSTRLNSSHVALSR